MKPEKLSILNNKKEKLVGHFYKNKSRTIVVMCHGIETNNGFPGIDDVFHWYHKMGASVFSFDFSGFGESEGENFLSLKQRDADIKTVVDYFSPLYKEIILYGVSFAGVSVAIAAAKYKAVTKLITINGFFTLNPKFLSWFQSLILGITLLQPRLWPEILYLMKNFRPENITIPTLVVCGEKDRIVNPKQSKYFYERLKTDKTFLSVPDGDHPLMEKKYYKVTKAVPEWIGKHVVWK